LLLDIATMSRRAMGSGTLTGIFTPGMNSLGFVSRAGLFGNLGGIGGDPLRGAGKSSCGAEHPIQRRRIGDQHAKDVNRAYAAINLNWDELTGLE
jgi:hypothetical protein